MFGTLKTIITGANARAEEKVRDTYSIELIEQKIREAQAGLQAAKATLASLIQRGRAEGRQIEALEKRVRDMTSRAKDALKGGREDMAGEAAQAIAEMENELTLRRDTASRLDTRILRLRQSVEVTNRRIIDLRQGCDSGQGRASGAEHPETPEHHAGRAKPDWRGRGADRTGSIT